jgi:hypothetical protein
LGVGQFGYVLEQIGFEKKEKIPELINILSHKDIYTYESEVIGKDNKNLIISLNLLIYLLLSKVLCLVFFALLHSLAPLYM